MRPLECRSRPGARFSLICRRVRADQSRLARRDIATRQARSAPSARPFDSINPDWNYLEALLDTKDKEDHPSAGINEGLEDIEYFPGKDMMATTWPTDVHKTVTDVSECMICFEGGQVTERLIWCHSPYRPYLQPPASFRQSVLELKSTSLMSYRKVRGGPSYVADHSQADILRSGSDSLAPTAPD